MSLRTCLIFVVLFSCTSLLSTVLSELQGSRIYPVVYKENCVFPFEYRGKSYTDCTIDGDNGKTPWCSMTTKYQGLINYCYDFRKTTLTCLDSFTMNNNPKVFTGCDYLSRTSLYKQCKTNDTKITYRYCTDTHDSPTLKLMDNRATCDPAYKNLSSDHTMCFGPNPYGTVVPFTQEEVDELLDVHNDFRNRVGSKYMFKLHWDVELAKLAQAHTNLCAFEHDLAVNRLSPKYNWKNGQNIVMATEINSSPGSLIYDMLTDEKKNFIYGSGCVDGGNTCLHYTQAMISNLTRMGCGQTHCVYPDRIERFVTCNYIQSQYSDNYQVPYVENKKSAVNCPSKIDPDTGLCDCGDKICAYDKGEYLDPNTCNCMTSSGVRTSRSVEPRQGFAAVKTGNSPQFMKRGLKKRSSK